jgi:hypothetical protein
LGRGEGIWIGQMCRSVDHRPNSHLDGLMWVLVSASKPSGTWSYGFLSWRWKRNTSLSLAEGRL